MTLAFDILFWALLAEAARRRFNAYRVDPDGEVEWLESMDAGNGWALREREMARWDFVAPQAY